MTLPVEEIEAGDRILIQSGEKIAIDGKIVTGQAHINEATITGESVPANKAIDDQVFSGTMIDNGYVEVIAEKVGDDTAFAKIIELVEEAQEGRARTQKFLERFANVYTPGILVLSVLVFLFSRNIELTLTFLVIACPGALVISAPVSLVAGIGNAARNGILIKGGEVMENLAKINALAFDKTGTLTQGKPTVTAVKSFGISEEELLLMSAEAEVVSEHHLGRAIVQEAENRGLNLVHKPENPTILKGRGLEVKLRGKLLYIGNRKGLQERNIAVSPEIENYAQAQEKKGITAVFVSDMNSILGIISIADKVREAAPPAIQTLKSAGVKHLVMLTGDNEHTANIVSEQLGMDKTFANLLPEEKVDRIKTCMGKGIKLGMIGDGVNEDRKS